jgi:transcriptional regulator with XRE-family HTH domain
MANDKAYKIVPERFEELLEDNKGRFFANEKNLPIYSKEPPRHRLKMDKKTDIAEALNIKLVTLSRNIHGVQSASPNTLALIKKFYGVNPDWLCGFSEDKTVHDKARHLLDNSELIDSIFEELLTLNGIKCVKNEDPDVTIGDLLDSCGYLIDGVSFGSEELHQIALKVKNYVKFEMRYQIEAKTKFRK